MHSINKNKKTSNPKTIQCIASESGSGVSLKPLNATHLTLTGTITAAKIVELIDE
jgi:hypothetical protein